MVTPQQTIQSGVKFAADGAAVAGAGLVWADFLPYGVAVLSMVWFLMQIIMNWTKFYAAVKRFFKKD